MAENYLSTNEIPFSDDESVREDDLIVDNDKPGDSPEVKQQRAQRRRERAAERERERKEQAEELAALKAKDAQRDRELAELRGAVHESRRGNSQPHVDPYQSELNALYTEQREAWLAAQAEVAAGTYTAERNAHYEQKGRDIESRKMQVHTRKAVAEASAANAANAGKAVWEQKYPEIYGNRTAYDYAEATFKRRKLLGQEATPELVDEVMEETRAAFKIGPKKTPSRVERERMTGISAGGGGSGGGSAGPTGGIDMSDRRWRKMALAAYSELPEKEAIQKWVDNEGKALRAKKII